LSEALPPQKKTELYPLRSRNWFVRFERAFTAGGLNLLRVRRGRERVARGFALGIIINFIPTFGFGVLISGFVARILGGHFGAGIIGGASLTFFWPVLFVLNLAMGNMILGSDTGDGMSGSINDEKVQSVLFGSQAFILGTAVNCVLAFVFFYVAILLLLVLVRRTAISYLQKRLKA
jgi:uncharacterized protein (DUF2062 family)